MLTRKKQLRNAPSKKPRKSNLQRRKDKVGSPYWKKKADSVWSMLIRSVGRCAVCGEAGNDAHHLIGRGRLATRHSLANGLCLCHAHHKWSNTLSAHGAPLAFAEWLQKNHPERWDWVCEHKNDICQKPDYKARYEELQGILDAKR
jgi:hypothetical protein